MLTLIPSKLCAIQNATFLSGIMIYFINTSHDILIIYVVRDYLVFYLLLILSILLLNRIITNKINVPHQRWAGYTGWLDIVLYGLKTPLFLIIKETSFMCSLSYFPLLTVLWSHLFLY